MPDADYFLSLYMSPPGKMALVLPRHDHCGALWRRTDDRVELVRYWELERWSGLKRHAVPLVDLDACQAVLDDLLATEGLAWSDISEVWGTPGLGDSQVITDDARRSGLPAHSISHLFSAVLLDSELFRTETIVGLAVDGGPDLALEESTPQRYYAGCVVRRGEMEVVAIESPASLYTASQVVFGHEPGTLMALVAASPLEVSISAEEFLGDAQFFGGPGSLTRAVPLVRGLVGHAMQELAGVPDDGSGLTEDERLTSAVMKVIQRACELVACRSVQRLLEDFSVDPSHAYLALAGGYALNCPTNSLLMDRFGFRGLLAPPCANDGGQALGLGLAVFHRRGDLPAKAFQLGHAFHGNDDVRLGEALDRWAPWVEDVSEFTPATFVEDLLVEPVAWVDGAAEIGPRALGHRSLLGDPRHLRTKDFLNKVKQRQWWRPVAPIVLEEALDEWFERSRPSPFMLEVFDVRVDKRDAVPAIVHMDGSARVQSLDCATDSRLHAAIREFDMATGVPLVCNTSLNDRGEPIVNDAVQALNFCVRKHIGVAYVGGRRVALRASDPSPDAPETRERERYLGDAATAAVRTARDAWKVAGVGTGLLLLLTKSPEMRSLVDSPAGGRGLALAASVAASQDPALGEAMRQARERDEWPPADWTWAEFEQ